MRSIRTIGLAMLTLGFAACVPASAPPPQYGAAPPYGAPPPSGPPSSQPPPSQPPPAYQPPPPVRPAPPPTYQPPPPVYPAPPPAPPPVVVDDRRSDRVFDRRSDWDKLGEQWVTGSVDRDVTKVGKRDGRFVAVAVVVES